MSQSYVQMSEDGKASLHSYAVSAQDIRYFLDVSRTNEGYVKHIKLVRYVDYGSAELLFNQEYAVPEKAQPAPVKALPSPYFFSSMANQPVINWNTVFPYSYQSNGTSGNITMTPNGTINWPSAPEAPAQVVDEPLAPVAMYKCRDILDESRPAAAYQSESQITVIYSDLGTYRVFYGPQRDIRVDIASDYEQLEGVSNDQDYPFNLDSETWIEVPLYME